MPNPVRSPHRLLLVAGLAVVAAWACGGLFVDSERLLHARYARALAGPSRTQGALLVALDEAALRRWDGGLKGELAAAITAGAPRMVIWPAAAVTWPEGHVGDPGYGGEGIGVDPLLGPAVVRAADPSFPSAVLESLEMPPRGEALPTRYVTQLPMVAALRVAAGEIPAGTFRDRVVIVGRTDAAALTVATPLGLMSPAQVETHALLGALDGALWRAGPTWWQTLAGTTAWALVLAVALRRRGLLSVLAITGLAVAVAVGVDAALFAAGVARLGVGPAIVVALVIAVARLMGLTERALPADLLERTGVAGGASGLHKVSDA